MEWIDHIVSILAGLAAAIPLVVQLVKYVKASIKEKNWTKLLNMIIDLMEQAEAKFDVGTDRKEWCLMMIKASADTIDYEIDYDAVSDMIDTFCKMTKVVNYETPAIEEAGDK